jgi:hypothetical protein
MSSPFFYEKIRKPSISFNEVLKKGAAGAYVERGDYIPSMLRAVVIGVDHTGGLLETPEGEPEGGKKLEQSVFDQDGKLLAKYELTPTKGPRNPQSSVRARVLAGNMDQYTDDDSLRTFWPLFPGADNPSPGELVYVMFDSEDMNHGLWVAKVPVSNPEGNRNQMLMSQTLQQIQAGKADLFDDSKTPEIGKKRDGSPIKQPQRLTSLFIE